MFSFINFEFRSPKSTANTLLCLYRSFLGCFGCLLSIAFVFTHSVTLAFVRTLKRTNILSHTYTLTRSHTHKHTHTLAYTESRHRSLASHLVTTQVSKFNMSLPLHNNLHSNNQITYLQKYIQSIHIQSLFHSHDKTRTRKRP